MSLGNNNKIQKRTKKKCFDSQSTVKRVINLFYAALSLGRESVTPVNHNGTDSADFYATSWLLRHNSHTQILIILWNS